MGRKGRLGGLAALIVLLAVTMIGEAQVGKGEWPAYSADKASTKYSPLDQINQDNVRNLRIVWRQSATPLEVRRPGAPAPVPINYPHTPLMVGGLLFMSSDALLAINRFHTPLPASALWVLATYWAAQWLIASALPRR